LTCEAYNHLPVRVGYRHPLITEFASRFGSPAFSMEVSDGVIARAAVERDSACGCARHVAQGLVGIRVTDAVQEAGMLHAHYPCFASMNQDADYHDTLMHVSGHILQDAVRSALLPFLPPVAYVRPEGLVEADPHNDPGEA
jgi:hypothetical protein